MERSKYSPVSETTTTPTGCESITGVRGPSTLYSTATTSAVLGGSSYTKESSSKVIND